MKNILAKVLGGLFICACALSPAYTFAAHGGGGGHHASEGRDFQGAHGSQNHRDSYGGYGDHYNRDGYGGYGGYGGGYGGGVYNSGYGGVVVPAYPPADSQPGMGDDSNALYRSYLRSNQNR